VLLLALAAARPASAQTTARPLPVYHSLFGPDEKALTRPQTLDVDWSVYSAADDNSFLATDADILDAALQYGRWYSGATIAVQYVRRPPHQVLTLNAISSGRYYPDLRQIVTTHYGGGLSLDSSPAIDWRVQMAGSASFSPFYQVNLSPNASGLWASEAPAADSPVAANDAAVNRQHAMQYGSSVGVTHTYSAQSALAFNYGFRYMQIFDAPDSGSQRGGILYTHGIAKDIGLRLGYAYGVAFNGVDSTAPIRSQDIDVGLNYGRSFSLSRRTSFGFTTGSSIISSGDGAHFRLTGSGHFSRRLTPRWTAQVLYDRGLQVPDGATRPFFSDTVAATVGGYFSRRASLRIRPTYSRGVVGFTGLTNAYNSYSSTTRFEVAVSHRLALYAEHFYYNYRFDSGVGLPALLTTGLNRQRARFGLTVWTPLVQ
jgi:hypothetical protein